MIRHIPTDTVYANRKEAKEAMGHSNYNKAYKKMEFEFVDNN